MTPKPDPRDAEEASQPPAKTPVDPAAQEEAAEDHEGGGYA